MFGFNFSEIIVIIIGILTIFNLIVKFVKPSKDLNNKQSGEITDLNFRVKNLESCQEEMKNDLKEIKNNHLNHIWKEINKIKDIVIRIDEKIKK